MKFLGAASPPFKLLPQLTRLAITDSNWNRAAHVSVLEKADRRSWKWSRSRDPKKCCPVQKDDGLGRQL
jgi:hypothetical protein